LKHDFYPLTAHFGEWVEVEGKKKLAWVVSVAFHYAQVIKHRHRARIVDIEQRLIWGSQEIYRSLLKAAGLSGNINTAYVERANLTIRECVSKLARRTWGTAQYATELCEHLEWWRTYYHFSRYHESLRVKLAEPVPRKGRQRPLQYRSATPAMATGLTRRRWSVMVPVSARDGTAQLSSTLSPNGGRAWGKRQALPSTPATNPAQRYFLTQNASAKRRFELCPTNCGCTENLFR